jgi:hypothetical protein
MTKGSLTKNGGKTRSPKAIAGNKDSITLGNRRDRKAGKLEGLLNRDSRWNVKRLAIDSNEETK